jgi:hypothetical protein
MSMDLDEIISDAKTILVFLVFLVLYPREFGIPWMKNGDNTIAYLSMGVTALLVIMLWILQIVTGKRNDFLFFGIAIGGGFAISWYISGSLSFGFGFVAYGLLIVLLVFLYQKISSQRTDLVSNNVKILAATLIIIPAIVILISPSLLRLDTGTLIIIGCLMALILYPVVHRYMHPVPDYLLDEKYSQELILPVSARSAYRFCRESVRFIPYGRISHSDAESGTLTITAADSVGRTSAITIKLESVGPSATKINLSGENEFIDFGYRILTGRNELFIRIIIRYLQEMTHTVPGRMKPTPDSISDNTECDHSPAG